MELQDYVRILRKRWKAIALCLVVGVALSAAYAWTQKPKFEASTQLFVAAKDTSGDVTGLAQGGQFTQQRVQSYADIVDSPEVAQSVATALGGSVTARTITSEVTATAPLNTVLINVHVTDPSAARAQAIANAVSDQFAVFAAELETPAGSTTSPVKVTVVKRADLPRHAVSPRKPLDLGIGFIIGLVVGLGAAVLRETLDTSVKDPEVLQRELELSALGAIAYDPDAKKRPLIVHVDRHSTRAEAFRQLRTNLQFIDIDHSPRSIVVTSSIPEEGKTTTATNLAIALAQSGMRVVLVEADLRRPKIAEYLGIEGAVGLTSVLIGQCDIDDAIQRWGEDGQLSVLPSGPTPPNPSELLGSRGMATLIHDLERAYDLVLVDAPPLLPVTDAAVISNVVSGCLVVVRHGHTKREQLNRAVQSLRAVDATIYGLVLTMTPTKGPDAYYYGYGYRYDKGKNRAHSELITPIARTSRRARSRDDGAHQPESHSDGSVPEPQAVNPTVSVLHKPLLQATEDDSAVDEPLAFFRR